jgi:hypothetical protein
MSFKYLAGTTTLSKTAHVYNDTQHNVTQCNDNQLNGTQQNDILSGETPFLNCIILGIEMKSIVMLSVVMALLVIMGIIAQAFKEATI